MSELKSKNKARGGHKSYLTQIFPEVDTCLEEYDESRKDQLKLWKEILEEQLETTAAFDREIQAIMESYDKVFFLIFLYFASRHKQLHARVQ